MNNTENFGTQILNVIEKLRRPIRPKLYVTREFECELIRTKGEDSSFIFVLPIGRLPGSLFGVPVLPILIPTEECLPYRVVVEL